MNKNKPYSNTNPIKSHRILSPNPITTLIEKKKLKSFRRKNHNPHNKSNKTNSKEQLQKHRFPVQRRCLQNPLPVKLEYIFTSTRAN